MPYYTLPGIETEIWRPANADDGAAAMDAELTRCLNRLRFVSEVVQITTGQLIECIAKGGNLDAFSEALTAVAGPFDRAFARTVEQWIEFRRSKVAYWGAPEQERLTATTMDAAVQEILGDLDDHYEYPETIEVAAYRPIRHDTNPSALDWAVDHLESNYASDDDGSGFVPSQYLRDAEDRFHQEILLEYPAYWHEVAYVVTVNVRRWLWRHDPTELRSGRGRRSFTTALCAHCLRPGGAELMKICPWCRRRGCADCHWFKSDDGGLRTAWSRCLRKYREEVLDG